MFQNWSTASKSTFVKTHQENIIISKNVQFFFQKTSSAYLNKWMNMSWYRFQIQRLANHMHIYRWTDCLCMAYRKKKQCNEDIESDILRWKLAMTMPIKRDTNQKQLGTNICKSSWRNSEPSEIQMIYTLSRWILMIYTLSRWCFATFER